MIFKRQKKLYIFVFVIATAVPIVFAQDSTVVPLNASNVSEETNTTEERIEDCWSEMNVTCLKQMTIRNFEDLWRKNEIHLTDSVIVEKIVANTSASSDDVQRGRGTGDSVVQWGEDIRLDQVISNLAKFLSSRALKVNLLDYVSLRMAKSPEHPDSLELTVDLVGETGGSVGEGKGQRLTKMLLPLLIGFKTTGAIILGISAVKILLLKALFVSKLALLSASFIIIKKLLSAVGVQHHPFLYSHQSIPYHHDYQQHGYNGVGAYGMPYYSAGGGYTAPSAAGGMYGGSGGEMSPSGGGNDLQAHYSNQNLAAVASGALRNNSGLARNDGGGSSGQRVFNLVKTDASRVPVVAYRKVVSTGRSSGGTASVETLKL